MTELYQHRARKRFGQNFLHDAGVIHRILRAIHGRPGERLLEIGPGQGALTEGLLGSGARLDVIELDQDLIPLLRLKFGLNPLFTLHQGDAMKYDLSSIAAGDRLRVVGNLPYNISTPLIFHLLSFADIIADMHFMLQKEWWNAWPRCPATATGVGCRSWCSTTARGTPVQCRSGRLQSAAQGGFGHRAPGAPHRAPPRGARSGPARARVREAFGQRARPSGTPSRAPWTAPPSKPPMSTRGCAPNSWTWPLMYA